MCMNICIEIERGGRKGGREGGRECVCCVCASMSKHVGVCV
jgi:hypothetical protein